MDDRLADLEARLDRYHDDLIYAINERDRLALDAAWGVHFAFCSAVSLGFLFLAFRPYIFADNWLIDAAFFVAATVLYFVVHAWSNGMRMKEVDSFHQLPVWEYKDQSSDFEENTILD